jgi:nitrite reductase/ring-hydroxylating ferredoxin subunit
MSEVSQRAAGEYAVGSLALFPPGTHRVVEVDGRQIGVFNIGGSLHALPNICPHQTGPVCEAKRLTGALVSDKESDWRPEWRFEGEIISCPWHGLQYHVVTGQCLNYRTVTLRRYPVEVRDGEVFVRLGGPSRS